MRILIYVGTIFEFVSSPCYAMQFCNVCMVVCRLYFTELRIGTPPKSYHVQVDTGSDLLWINCVGCQTCPRKSDLGV